MERSLVKHGESTLMVSVPAIWVKRHHLQKGDVVDVVDEGDALSVFRMGIKKARASQAIHFKDADYDLIRAFLCKLYRGGVDEITVTYDAEAVFPVVHKVVSSIVGYEITENSSGSCIIRNLVKEYDFDVKTVLPKIVAITSHMFSLSREILVGKKTVSLDEIALVRDEARKFRDASFVMLRTDTIQKSFADYYIIHSFEQNATYLSWMVKSFNARNMARVSPGFIALLDRINNYFIKALVLMKKKDEEYLHFILDGRRRLLRDCEKVSRKGGNEAMLVIYLAMLVQNLHNPKSALIA